MNNIVILHKYKQIERDTKKVKHLLLQKVQR